MTSYAQTLQLADTLGSKLIGFDNTNVYDKLKGVSVSVKEFGAVGDGATDDTVSIQAALDAVKLSGANLRIPAGTYLVNAAGLNFSFNAGSLLSKLRIGGDGPRATILKPTAGSAPHPIINLSATAVPTEANVAISDLSIDGGASANNYVGIRLTGIADFSLERVIIENCVTGVDILGSLIGSVNNCTINRNSTGIAINKSGTIYANAITIRDSRVNLNTAFAIDLVAGSLLRVRDCDIEGNGATGNTATGGIIVRSTSSGEFNYCLVVIDGTWLEGNLGRGIQTENVSNLLLAIRGTQVLAQEAGRSIYVAGALAVSLYDCMLPSPGDTADITCTRLSTHGGVIYSLVGTRLYEFVENTTIGSDPYPGNVRDNITLGGIASGGGFVKFGWDSFNGLCAVSFNGGSGTLRAVNGNFDAGLAYKVANVQVLGVRATGWTAATGTPNKGAFATYAGQTMAAGYVQATAQTTDNAVLANSQRIKAIEDALRTHGLIN